MLKFLHKQLKNEKGFTLVELATVVVIIGILALIAVPIYRNVTTNAEKNACFANQRTIEGAWAMYKASGENSGWPDEYIAGAKKGKSEREIELENKPTKACTYTITEDGIVTCSVDEHQRTTPTESTESTESTEP